MVTVRAPATSANLGSGFDVFGAALTRPADVVTVEKAAETTIEVTGVGAQYIPEDPKKNTVGAVVEGARRARADPHRQGVRPASGLGSSAASAAGAAVALNRLYDRGLALGAGPDRRRGRGGRLRRRALGQRRALDPRRVHGDNERGDPRRRRLDSLVVCLPDVAVSTRDARGSSPRPPRWTTSSRRSATPPLSRSGCAARSRPRGRRHERPCRHPERARLITGTTTVRAAAFDAGATGVTVSGAGPAILAVCRDGQRRGSPPRCSTLSPTLASTPAPTRRGSGGVDGA